jgi:hypothetical protein
VVSLERWLLGCDPSKGGKFLPLGDRANILEDKFLGCGVRHYVMRQTVFDGFGRVVRANGIFPSWSWRRRTVPKSG